MTASHLRLVFDLDDTLYAERQYALGGFAAVGAWAAREHGIEGIAERLMDLLDAGHLGQSFRMALDEKIADLTDADVHAALKAYGDHTPRLSLFEDAALALDHWRRGPLGLITDGNPKTQMAKVAALGIAPRFREIVYTGALGPKGAMHKPHPRAFEIMQAALRTRPDDRFVYVGDNPNKDFVAPNAMGWMTVLVDRPTFRRTRIHPLAAPAPGGAPQHTIADLSELAKVLASLEALG